MSLNACKPHRAWAMAFSGMLITAVTVPAAVTLFSFFILDVTAELGISRSAFTLSTAIIQGLGMVVSTPATLLLGKGRFRLWMGLSVLGYSAAYASYGLAHSLWHLLLSSFFIGLFYMPGSLIATSIVVTNWFEVRRGLAMSVVMAGIGFGGFVFSPVLAAFLRDFGWRASYGLMGLIIAAVCLPLVVFVLRRDPADIGLKPYGASPPTTARTPESGQESVRNPLLTLDGLWRKPFFQLLLLGMLCCGLINSGVLGQFPPALEEALGSSGRAASVISTYAIMSMAGNVLLGWFNDRFGTAAAVACGCLCFAVALALMLCVRGNGFYGMAVVLGPGLAIGTVLPPLLTVSVFGRNNYSCTYGLVNSGAQAGLTCGSLLAAGVYDVVGSYTPVWIVFCGLSFVTLACWVAALRGGRRLGIARGR